MTARPLLTAALFLPLLALLGGAGPASAQPYAGVYLSGVPASEHNLEALRTFSTTGVTDHFHVSNARFGDSIVYGRLLGYQLIPRVAAELDVYYLSPGLKAQTRLASSPSAGTALIVTRDGDVDFTVAALCVVWNYRLLPSEPIADGRLQLYAGTGAAVFFTDVDATGTTTFAQFRLKDSDTSLGPQLKVGARWFFTRNLGAFLEFRWAHTTFAVSDTGVTAAGVPVKLKVSSDLDLPLALAGLSWHFR
jgi:opacity protein-like surface antigen